VGVLLWLPDLRDPPPPLCGITQPPLTPPPPRHPPPARQYDPIRGVFKDAPAPRASAPEASPLPAHEPPSPAPPATPPRGGQAGADLPPRPATASPGGPAGTRPAEHSATPSRRPQRLQGETWGTYDPIHHQWQVGA
jgi:hypothetical protein